MLRNGTGSVTWDKTFDDCPALNLPLAGSRSDDNILTTYGDSLALLVQVSATLAQGSRTTASAGNVPGGESGLPAGRRRGNKWLRSMLVQAAGPVGRMKGKN